MKVLTVGLGSDGLNLALDEALLRRLGSSSRDPVARIYSGEGSLVLGARSGLSADQVRALEHSGLSVLRRASSGDPYMIAPEWVSLTLVTPCSPSETASKTCEKLSSLASDLLSAAGYELDFEQATGSARLNGSRVFIGGFAFYRSGAMLQGGLWVGDAEPSFPIFRDARSLSEVLGIAVETKVVFERMVEAARELGWGDGRVEDEDLKLADLLWRKKYSSRAWIERSLEPLTLKDLLIELYVANPPTSICKEFAKILSSAISGLEDRVEVRIWRRGMGRPPGVPVSGGLVKASKESKIPAIVINGELLFYCRPPAVGDVRKAILKRLSRED
ncbi:MAG: hypothetical protein QI223_00655 [Candidatus Korarchaeota archaeon]|nr:hypothetical protein [Candidatus Korarchaeota archaeon]